MGSHEDYLGARPAQRDAPRLMPENGPLPRAFSTADLLVRDGPDSDNDEADFASDASVVLLLRVPLTTGADELDRAG